jgi:beta-glucosidase
MRCSLSFGIRRVNEIARRLVVRCRQAVTRPPGSSSAALLPVRIDLRGYLHWSALDNYEWGSFVPTFGLIAVDRQTFDRTPKPSAHWLGRVAKAGSLPITPAG